jgi:tRNA U54 and U55 pseudouridine synthase Pus10
MLCCHAFLDTLIRNVQQSMEPYGGFKANTISLTSPTITLPSVLYIRAQAVSVSLELLFPHIIRTLSPADLVSAIKDRLRNLIRIKIHEPTNHDRQPLYEYPSACLEAQEAGYMFYHILLLTPIHSQMVPFLLPSSDWLHLFIKESQSRKDRRKRRYPMDLTTKQGGDPRKNLEQRILRHNHDNQKQYFPLLEKNQMMDMLGQQSRDKAQFESMIQSWMEHLTSSNHDTNGSPTDSHSLCCCTIVDSFACSWRNHFYIQGRYTKSRRDISQSPFYVHMDAKVDSIVEPVDDEPQHTGNSSIPGSKWKRLGISSVEEEICPVLERLGCGGISTLNNEFSTTIKSDSHSRLHGTVYGKCKFHASGREDMNVRMLLPSTDIITLEQGIGGRPFVCEVIDAFRLPTEDDLNQVVDSINHVVEANEISETSPLEPNRYFGRNPNGVGVSCLTLCSAKLFSTLQSETEDKIKYYGCLCWSEKDIPSQEYLDKALGRSYPLLIRQSTPIRVLHRRSGATRERYIIRLQATRVSSHYFRLHLATSGGTYSLSKNYYLRSINLIQTLLFRNIR